MVNYNTFRITRIMLILGKLTIKSIFKKLNFLIINNFIKK